LTRGLAIVWYQDGVTDRRLLDMIHDTPWIADLLTWFDFEVARAADGPILPVTLASGEPLEAIAGDSTGGSFLLVGTGDPRPVLYVGSECEGGLIARSLRDALTACVAPSGCQQSMTRYYDHCKPQPQTSAIDLSPGRAFDCVRCWLGLRKPRRQRTQGFQNLQ
jgi:hypothetical protein